MQGTGTISRCGLGQALGWALGLALVAAPRGFAAGAGDGQAAAQIKPAAHTQPMAQAEPVDAELAEVHDAPVEAVREVDDPATGVRWLLVRDQMHPAGPGRWIREGERGRETGKQIKENQENKENLTSTASSDSARIDSATKDELTARADEQVKVPAPLVMRGGDPIVVVQQTPVLTARLAAVALEPAAKGKLIEARLKANDARVWVIAVGPGEATLAPPGLAPPGETGQWRAR